MFVLKDDLPFSHKMLWASVLRRAVFDYILYKGVRQYSLEWKRAFHYIFVPDQTYENGLSFEEVCELFGWDPGYLRRVTTKLTRADVKRMETTQFREEFVYDAVKTVVEQTERWKSEKFAAPFLPLYQYEENYRRRMQPRVVHRESFLTVITPLVRWEANS